MCVGNLDIYLQVNIRSKSRIFGVLTAISWEVSLNQSLISRILGAIGRNISLNRFSGLISRSILFFLLCEIGIHSVAAISCFTHWSGILDMLYIHLFVDFKQDTDLRDTNTIQIFRHHHRRSDVQAGRYDAELINLGQDGIRVWDRTGVSVLSSSNS